jgi:A/G-specific adenine glycosylase
MDRQSEFVEVVWEYYAKHGRDLPWRTQPFDAYTILVSEVMLQQTKVTRVVPKYQAFLKQFPTIESLANNSLSEVIRAWSGFGYNRRAKSLHEAAKQLAPRPEPWSLEDLTACKGIGFNTAAAVITYAYNQPLAFIETNIRTVYIHHFFADQTDVDDKALLPLIEQTLDQEHPREWYWALMDYGSFLKTTVGNAARFSKHHTKQSIFQGSKRQIRGQVLRLVANQSMNKAKLQQHISDDRLHQVLDQLVADGLLEYHTKRYRLAN